MKTIQTKVYEFDELDERSKDKAREWWRQDAIDYEWWESTYEDAERIGLKLTAFDLDRSLHAKGSFISGACECADKIMAEHGDTCETYKTADSFLADRDAIVESAERDENGEFVSEYELDQKLDACESEFLRAILEDYAWILQHEYEYQLSDEQADEAIRANGYTFTASGKRFG